jgi:hypothetical protein
VKRFGAGLLAAVMYLAVTATAQAQTISEWTWYPSGDAVLQGENGQFTPYPPTVVDLPDPTTGGTLHELWFTGPYVTQEPGAGPDDHRLRGRLWRYDWVAGDLLPAVGRVQRG